MFVDYGRGLKSRPCVNLLIYSKDIKILTVIIKYQHQVN